MVTMVTRGSSGLKRMDGIIIIMFSFLSQQQTANVQTAEFHTETMSPGVLWTLNRPQVAENTIPCSSLFYSQNVEIQA